MSYTAFSCSPHRSQALAAFWPAWTKISGRSEGGVTGDTGVEGGCHRCFLGTEEVPSFTGRQEPYRRLLEHPRGKAGWL